MNNMPVISLVLHGHFPLVRHPETEFSPREHSFFESISETYIPLLEIFDRLDRDLIPFRMGLSLSPTLCHMLGDELLLERYLDYTKRQMDFGIKELDRQKANPERQTLAERNYNRICEKRIFFAERCKKNILKCFDYYQKKGRLEILATAATHAFLPFYTDFPEAVQAQFEVAISTYRDNFEKYPQGFWLPELGWKSELDSWLRYYNFGYTIAESHALPLAFPEALHGNFYPAKTPLGIIIFGRNFYASKSIAEIKKDPLFRFENRDQGFELPAEQVKDFVGNQGCRIKTGYRYWANGADCSGEADYDPVKAGEKSRKTAKDFLDSISLQLKSAQEHMENTPVSLCAFEADDFGRFWHEGGEFLETLFREAAKSNAVQFQSPAEYFCRLDGKSIQSLLPEYSSWGSNGYGETWLDSSNDWMYCHAMRALERMVEIAERLPNSTGLRERALNQAAREILLATASDWPKMLCKKESSSYARLRIVSSLRNFTTIYEALGSNYISTEWLTQLERRNNIFPNINYRVFRRKR